jgi:hypothetical protein
MGDHHHCRVDGMTKLVATPQQEAVSVRARRDEIHLKQTLAEHNPFIRFS